MQNIRRILKPVSYLVSAGLLALTLHMPAAQASLVGTEIITAAASAQQNRAQLNTLLARQDVRDALLARGVDLADAKARVSALTDDEIQQLAKQIDEMPAGGDALGIILGVLIILVLLDLLCLTNIFPFISKAHCKR